MFFIELIEASDRNRRQMEGLPKVQRMLDGKISTDEYVRFLKDLYHIVWHFCPIMSLAASRCDDRFSAVRNHLYHNIAEEKGHERMVVEDVAAFGVDRAAIEKAAPTPAVQAMIAYNYYTCERMHPCSVLGMLYVLEIISSIYGGHVAKAIAKGLGMPPACGFSFLDSHASMDADHMANLAELLQEIVDLDAQAHIINAVQMNFYLLTEILSAT